MGRTLWLQCDTGIAGDMVVGALLDAGASEQGLREALAGLDLAGYEVRIAQKPAGALVGCDFDVVLDDEHDNHDHDMAYLYGEDEGDHHHHHGHGHHDHDHDHEHDHDHGHHHHHVDEDACGHEHHCHCHDDEDECCHGHHHHEEECGHGHHHHHHDGDDHEHGHHHHHHHHHGGHRHEHHHDHHHDHDHINGHDHVHRNLADILAILDSSTLSEPVRERAEEIFTVIAEAEAKAHGETVESVHFHEVGAVDSIVDVVAAAWCLDDLAIDDVYVSPLAEGEGHVRCAHGVLPIPVPAVANICEAHGLVLRRAHRTGELVTPTGAAIAAATRSIAVLPELYRIVSVGRGTGKRAYEVPSVLVATIIEEVAEEPQGGESTIWKLECEVDDCTGEALGYCLDHLMAAGAREAHFVPVFMKKSRPAYKVEVISDEERIPELEAILFADTTTIGVRRYPVERTVLAREQVEVSCTYGTVQTKRVTLPSGVVRAYPEHESVRALADETGVGYQDVYRAAISAITAISPEF